MLLLIVTFSFSTKLVILVMLEWDIFLETSIENKLVLKDVRHVPNICLNLISIGRLDDERFTNSFGESKMEPHQRFFSSGKRRETKQPLCHGS